MKESSSAKPKGQSEPDKPALRRVFVYVLIPVVSFLFLILNRDYRFFISKADRWDSAKELWVASGGSLHVQERMDPVGQLLFAAYLTDLICQFEATDGWHRVYKTIPLQLYPGWHEELQSLRDAIPELERKRSERIFQSVLRGEELKSPGADAALYQQTAGLIAQLKESKIIKSVY
ncbi:MAG: hypothetical protein P1V35_01140 [Planctomycetota bacterium]|nr:hypothetical protein [Planctomycetota bacterium]